MATIQSEFGEIILFEDFTGPEWIIAETAASGAVGDFRVVGAGLSGTDGGVICDESTTPLNGVGILQTSATAKDTTALATALCFDVALMAPIVIEARVYFVDCDTKNAFIGLTNANTDGGSIEDSIISTDAGTTIENTATYICGFYFSDELTDDQDWHAVYKGGTASQVTDTTALDLNADIVEGSWQILRLEVDPNGTARWFVDGVLKKTLAGACSTTADLGVVCGLGTTGASSKLMYVDYLLVRANRDWTV